MEENQAITRPKTAKDSAQVATQTLTAQGIDPKSYEGRVRLAIIQATFDSKVGFGRSRFNEVNSKLWDKSGYPIEGKEREAFAELSSDNGPKYMLYCKQLTTVMAIAGHLKASENETFVKAAAMAVRGWSEAFLLSDEKYYMGKQLKDASFDPAKLLPGDQVFIQNPAFYALSPKEWQKFNSGQGEEGGNLFYIGRTVQDGKESYWFTDIWPEGGHEPITFEQKRERMMKGKTIPAYNARLSDFHYGEDYKTTALHGLDVPGIQKNGMKPEHLRIWGVHPPNLSCAK